MIVLTSADAAAGCANRTPSAAAIVARAGLTSISSTSQRARFAEYAMRHPTVPAPMTVTRLPAIGSASQTTLIAVSMFAARTARCGGTPSGGAGTAVAGTTYFV